MKEKCKYSGFSLTEVLMAVGILAVGMIFVAGVFPVAIHFTTIAAERTTAAVVADEAFAKIRLHKVAPAWLAAPLPNICYDFNDVSFVPIRLDEFEYPSTPPAYTGVTQKQYYWSALCRRVDPSPANRSVQVTVFVSRKIGASGNYWNRALMVDPPVPGALNPVPISVNVGVSPSGRADELLISDNFNDGISEEAFINDGYTIVDNQTGRLYRVLERYADTPDTILLDGPWRGINPPQFVWVVPPPVGGGRGPCIAVYQKVIQF